MPGDAKFSKQILSEHVLVLNDRMEESAIAGDWDEVADIMVRRNAMLQSIEEPMREASLIAARRSTLRVQRLAESARTDVGEKLRQLQRGKRATDSYLAHA